MNASPVARKVVLLMIYSSRTDGNSTFDSRRHQKHHQHLLNRFIRSVNREAFHERCGSCIFLEFFIRRIGPSHAECRNPFGDRHICVGTAAAAKNRFHAQGTIILR